MENNEIMMNEEIVESNTFEDDYSYEEEPINKKNVAIGALGGAAVIGLGVLAYKKLVKPGAKKAKAKLDGWKENRKEKKAEKAEEKKAEEYVKIDESKVTAEKK